MRIKRRAFMIMDIIMALLILGVLMTLMAVGLSSQQRAAIKLANTRAACNAAEQALADLQQGKPITMDHVQINRINGGTAVENFTWVRVTATAGGRSASLTGLAKSTALNGS